jgi:hypothetical protein
MTFKEVEWPRWLSAALRLRVAKEGSRQSGREGKKM